MNSTCPRASAAVLLGSQANSAGPGDDDANEDAKDAARHLTEDNEGDVRHQKVPRTVDKGV